MTNDLKLEPGKAYLRLDGSDEWQEAGTVTHPPSSEGTVEVRRRIEVAKVLSRSWGGVEVDVTDEFDLEHGITLTAILPSLEAAEAFAHRWCGKEDT